MALQRRSVKELEEVPPLSAWLRLPWPYRLFIRYRFQLEYSLHKAVGFCLGAPLPMRQAGTQTFLMFAMLAAFPPPPKIGLPDLVAIWLSAYCLALAVIILAGPRKRHPHWVK